MLASAHLDAVTDHRQPMYLLATDRTGARARREPRMNAVGAKEMLAAVEGAERSRGVQLSTSACVADGAQLVAAREHQE